MTNCRAATMTRKSEAGQAIVFITVAMVVLLAVTGLAIDMGVLRYEKRLQQTAADAAAIAGASDLAFGGHTAAMTAALAASAANGFADNTNGGVCATPPTNLAVNSVSVTVCNPPIVGPHKGDNDYVEAYVSAGDPTFFMKVVGINQETVTARGVATALSGGAPGSGCIYTLQQPNAGIEGVNINGSATLNAPTCGIEDNGNYNTQGNALNVTAANFGVSGGLNQSGPGGTLTCIDTPNACPTAMPAAPDPLGSVTPPPQPPASTSCPTTGLCDVTTSGTETLYPGTYDSIIFGSNSTVTLEPGIYYINGSGGVTFNGAATVTGDGVMFYFTGTATINATGGGNNLDMQLTAPSPTTCSACASQYDGILFYQNPSDLSAPYLGGDDSTQYLGALYFPSVQLTFFGNSTNYTAGMVVAGALAFSGNPTVNITGPGGSGGGPTVAAIESAVLVE